MDDFKRPRNDAKLKKRAYEDPQFAEDLWRMRNPEDGGEQIPFEEILVALQRDYGIASSLGALSDFYPWLDRKYRWEAAAAAADQAKQQRLAENPETSLEELENLGQFVFTNEAIASKDTKAFVQLRRTRQNDRKIEIDERRMAVLEAAEKRQRDAEEAIRKINSDETLSPEAQRAKVLEKMDEFFGLKKSNG
ncbi:hypothetical protein JIN85_16955 [Luteolibacter pohnpeiensis]|uniref:Uncharacterized protein n=1 Tax=Luteolibacter pohnpeiensis TaxID=454153 RepID=A0A934SDG4_9BACT|nr:hypothetical protein [Luteolibacter pohnpeiensis]MBK1884112.1 hypothetical protein [Luteolibacter pohnpeiensis]